MIRIVIAFVVSLFFAFAAHAASLRIDSGASAAGGHEEEIDVISVVWAGGAAPRGKSGPGTVTIVVVPAKGGDVDGRDFLVWQRHNTMIPSMTLKADDGKTYKLSRCFVKSWSTSGDADDRPAGSSAVGGNETITIGFAKSETV